MGLVGAPVLQTAAQNPPHISHDATHSKLSTQHYSVGAQPIPSSADVNGKGKSQLHPFPLAAIIVTSSVVWPRPSTLFHHFRGWGPARWFTVWVWAMRGSMASGGGFYASTNWLSFLSRGMQSPAVRTQCVYGPREWECRIWHLRQAGWPSKQIKCWRECQSTSSSLSQKLLCWFHSIWELTARHACWNICNVI